MKDNSLTELAAQLSLLENQVESDGLPHLLPGMKEEILQLEEERMNEAQMRGQLLTAEAALTYILAGNSYFTVRSKKTGTRFTFRIAKPKWAQKENTQFWYVSLLNGPDNESNYTYAANLKREMFRDVLTLHHTGKTKVTAEAPSMIALRWILYSLQKEHLPATLEIWHEGRCGRCGRKLTVPESLQNGIGPECAKMLA